MLYSYQKATPTNPHPGRIIPLYLKVIPTFVSAIGLGLVAFVAFPLVGYQLKDISLFTTITDEGLLSPASYESQATANTGPVVTKGGDFTKASSWFPGSLQNDLFIAQEKVAASDRSGSSNFPGSAVYQPAPNSYKISIPSLGIETANVNLKDEDLTKSLVHYPQTALPGQLGSPVIFGHSTLPQFFSPTNYKAIFSTLPKLKLGSDIFITYNGSEYTYRVSKSYEVKPSELWVLKQDYSQKTLKVVTCVPPGTTLRRLIVEAQLITN